MGSAMEFAAVASAIIASVGLALGLEWLTLNWLMRAMPGRSQPHHEEHK